GHEHKRRSRHRNRSRPPLRRGRGGRRRPPGCHALRRRRRARGSHGPVRLRQVHAHAPDGGARQADGRQRHDRRRGRRLAVGPPGDTAPAQAHRLRLPVLQPASDADGGGERAPAALDRRREAGAGFLRGSAGARRSQRPAPPPPRRALRRPATARRDRPRAGRAADGRLCGRADRQPRLAHRRRDPRAAPLGRGGVRPDDGHGHARRARRDDRGPCAVPRRRADRAGAPEEPCRRHPGGDGTRSLMTRVALSGLLGRKLRATLTAIAIVLGVAMVSGTYVLTDSIDKAFGSIFTDVRKGSDVVVSGKAAFDLGGGTLAPPFTETLLPKIRSLPDVAEAEPSVNGEAHVIGHNGKAITYGGAPNLGFSIARGASRFNPLTLVSGSWPGPDQVVIDASMAKKEHFAVGQTVGVQGQGAVQQLKISGIVRFGSVATIGGATLAGFDLPTAQRLFDKTGKLDEIALAAKPGVSDAKLLDEVRSVLPSNTQARSAAEQAKKDAQDTNQFISFLRGFLLAFAGIALFVGSFVIANSLSITIAQRTREFATLRTLGATRRQVLRAIVIEALVVGALASVTGLFVGLALAKGLFRLFDAVGFTLPNSGLVFGTRTIVVALLVGVLVTLVASLRPALRATRVPPIAAVREGAQLPPSRFHRFRTLGSGVLTAFGFAALVWGLFKPGLGTTGVLVWMGIGTLLIFFGVALLSERAVRPLAAAVGPPARWLLTASWLVLLFATPVGWIYLLFHRVRHHSMPTLVDRSSSARLALENTQRNPQRTASTAAALMIGLALVTLVAVLAAGITATFRSAVNEAWKHADYAITAQNNFSPIPTSAADAAARMPLVTAVSNVRT